MILEQKMKEILKYVWSPKPHFYDEDLNNISNSVFKLLDDGSDIEVISNFLYKVSVEKNFENVSVKKCEDTAKLIMSWHNPTPPVQTKYGILRIRYQSRFGTCLFYKNATDVFDIRLSMTFNYELIIYPDEIPLLGEEKEELLKAMEKLFRKIIIYSDETAEYIKKNAYW